MSLAVNTTVLSLSDQVEKALRGVREKQVDAARALLERLSDENTLERTVRTLLTDPEEMRRCAAQSYRHPNGFDKIVLASGTSGWKLRLNIWWPGEERYTENIHNHRWDFASTVIAGQLETDFYACGDGGTEMNEYVYRPAGENAAYFMHHNGVREVRKIFSGTIGQGTSYSLERSVFHRVRHDRKTLTATLMLHTAPTRDSAVTLTPDSLFPDTRNQATKLSEETLARHLLDLLSR